jgi:hypothetical protein
MNAEGPEHPSADDLVTLVRESLVASAAQPDLPETRGDALAGPASPGSPETPVELAAHPYRDGAMACGGLRRRGRYRPPRWA